MQQKPFLASAVVGNSRLLATLTGDGELQRIFWPNVDGGQHLERLLGGLSVDGASLLWQDDARWQHSQEYEVDQNILVTTSRLESGLALQTVDSVTPGRDILVRRLTFMNGGARPVALRYALFQWVRIDENPLYNTAMFDEASDSLVAFRRDIFVATGGDRTLSGYCTGKPEAVRTAAEALRFAGGAPLHGDMAAAGLWDLGVLAPGSSVSLTLFAAFGRSIGAVRELLAGARAAGAEALLDEIRAYWTEWLSRATPVAAEGGALRTGALLPGIPAVPATPEQIETLYRRSLLVFKLMSDEQTGAVIAAPEFDPGFTACGGYAYCWGRDAGYITVAMDLAGYHDLAGAFYKWAQVAQEPEGWWMHRHYASGHWGPSWGLLQVDETGSILYGMAVHARLHGGVEFAASVWESVHRAAEWLVAHTGSTGLTCTAVDLWEERVSELTYSTAAVAAGLRAAAELALMVGQPEAASRYQTAAEQLVAALLTEGVRDGIFLRARYMEVSEQAYLEALHAGKLVRRRTGPKGLPVYELVEDRVLDSSLLGISTPFEAVPADHPVMAATATALKDALWYGPAGGLKRYSNDRYRDGNPWILTTLWYGLWAADAGDLETARQMLDWAVARQTAVGLLPEQVDPVTGEPAWVVPLTWSHAMFVLLTLRLYGQGRRINSCADSSEQLSLRS